MKSKKALASSKDTSAAVDQLVAELDHPLKREIDRVRRTILGANSGINEGVKWNSLSFRTTEYFATVHLRTRDQVQLVFHRGAKAREDQKHVEVTDPRGLAKWLAADRCLVSLGKGQASDDNQPALAEFVRQWIVYV